MLATWDQASCTSPSSSTPIARGSIVGWRVSTAAHASFVLGRAGQALAHDRKPPASRRPTSITATEAAQYVSHQVHRTAWPRRASSPPSAVSAIATTTRWPRRSMASTRPKSSTGVDRGDRSRRSSSPPSNGWIGSTTGGLEPIGNIPPAEAEKRYYAILEKPAMAA